MGFVSHAHFSICRKDTNLPKNLSGTTANALSKNIKSLYLPIKPPFLMGLWNEWGCRFLLTPDILPLIPYLLSILSALFDNPVHLFTIRTIQRTVSPTHYSLFILSTGQCLHIFTKQRVRLAVLRLYTEAINGGRDD